MNNYLIFQQDQILAADERKKQEEKEKKQEEKGEKGEKEEQKERVVQEEINYFMTIYYNEYLQINIYDTKLFLVYIIWFSLF